ncbi:MAG: hypothetical protein ACAH59_08075 [Pseudobdellovibrionaceae bacterium]
MKKYLAPLVLFVSSTSFAHVKWFSKERFENPPLSFSQLNHPTFWGLFLLSVVTLALLVWLDRKLEQWPAYLKMNQYFDQYTDKATLILRIFTGASLLLAWQADSMIAPDLEIPSPLWGWYQFVLALLLLLRVSTPVAGFGMILLYLFAVSRFGLFHLLDYFIYLGVGFFFFVSNFASPKLKDLRIPALYSSLGFSLCWVALEKIFYPNWGLEVLRQAPGLAMGLPNDFFLIACAFVELCLGYLLIICLLQRPLALTITIVFFITTSFFGKTEVVGHTLLHGALLVFVVVGQKAAYKPPIAFHKKLGLRMAFAAVNFIVLFALLAFPYWHLSQNAYEHQRQHPAPVNEH